MEWIDDMRVASKAWNEEARGARGRGVAKRGGGGAAPDRREEPGRKSVEF